MISHTTDRFRKAYQKLPLNIQRKAREAYQLWKQDQFHPSLQFKRVHSIKPIYAVRIGIGWRALGVKSRDSVVWFWIGSHEDYNNVISQL
ncbi:MAG: hypothetical protein ACRD63_00385 [Pyrinomonadaceae bacterium]